MKMLLIIAIKRLIFLILRPFVLLFALLCGKWRLIQRIEWKRKHGYVNVWQTLLVNFSSFPVSIAIKFPIVVYECIDFINRGKIELETDKVSCGMLIINSFTWRSKSITRIENDGIITIKEGGAEYLEVLI